MTKKKNMLCTWKIIKNYYNKLQKKIIPKFICMKKFFWGKNTCDPFLKESCWLAISHLHPHVKLMNMHFINNLHSQKNSNVIVFFGKYVVV
jgi:hypothetical protein